MTQYEVSEKYGELLRIKNTNICIMGVSKKRREWGYKIFEKVIAKSSKFDKQ
jgi:hypothetical protein